MQMQAVGALLAAAGRKPRASPRAAAPRWKGLHTVLCGVDFSAHSRRALQYADAIARGGHAALKVVYVNEPLLVAAAAAAFHDRQLVARSARELRAFIAATLTVRASKRVAARVSIGDPADEILRAAGRLRADLVVLGMRGASDTSRLSRAIMGSTTMSVLQRTTVAVLAVPGVLVPSAARRPQRSRTGRTR